MKCQLLIIGLWTVMEVAFGQYQHMMQLPHQNLQRTSPLGMMRFRGPMVTSQIKWPASTNQVQTIAQRPYKPLYPYMKGPPAYYRPQKPFVKAPSMYNAYWKPPINLRPSPVKEMFRGQPPTQPLITPSAHKLAIGPLTSQKLVGSSSSPVKNLLNQPYVKATETQKKQNTHTVSNFFTGYHSSGSPHTSQPLIAPITPAPSVHYPIRVDSDRGPIHTIPAPNLSLTDKPIVVAEYNNYLEPQVNKAVSGHKYEVTEEPADRGYHDQFIGSNSPYVSGGSFPPASKIAPSAHYFSSITNHEFLPQPSALKTQVAPSLSSHDLFALLSDASPQQQIVEAYSFPVVQQTQFIPKTTLDNTNPIQSFGAIIHPGYSGVSNIQENVLYRPDTFKAEKTQESSFSNPSNYAFESHKLTANNNNGVKFRNDFFETNSVHNNVARNTLEGSAINIHKNNYTNSVDSETGSSNIVNKASVPLNIEPGNYNESFINAYLSEIDNIASSSISPDFIASLKTKDKKDLSSSKTKKSSREENIHSPLESDYFSAFNSYFVQNSAPQNSKESYFNQYNDFIPNQGVPLSKYGIDDKQVGNENINAPVRIYSPEQYNDNNEQPTENIQVSASLNAEDSSKNDMMIIFENEDNDSAQHYDTKAENQNENNRTQSETIENNQKGKSENNMKSKDVIVTVPENASNPTLDILTKDWKTSIIIKPKGNNKANTKSNSNKASEFGNRIKPKKEE